MTETVNQDNPLWRVVEFQDGTYGLRKTISNEYVFVILMYGPDVSISKRPENAARFDNKEAAMRNRDRLNRNDLAAAVRKTDYGTPVDG